MWVWVDGYVGLGRWVCGSGLFLVIDRNVFEMTEKNLSHFGQNVWKYMLKTLLWRVAMKLWDKCPKCFSNQNVSAKNDRNVSAKEKPRCGYVCKGRQGEMERIHPPPTNTKTDWISFCEVGYVNFWPNFFATSKRCCGWHAASPWVN